MVSAYLLNGSDDTAQKLYDKAGAEATAAYLDIYTATARTERMTTALTSWKSCKLRSRYWVSTI